MQPLISIITPVFNSSQTLDECIVSVLKQTYDNWELILADDCSTDDSIDIIRRYQSADSRVLCVRLETNSGPAQARNAALSIARGRWISFLDSDDWWDENKLLRTFEFAELNQSTLTYTAYKRVKADGSVSNMIDVPATLTYSQLLKNTAILTSSVLINTTEIGKIKMEEVYYDDFVCWLNILKKINLAKGINEDLVRYRITHGSVSRNKFHSAVQVWKTYRNIEQLGATKSFFCFVCYLVNAVKKYRFQ